MIPEFLKELLIKQYNVELTNKIIEGYSTKRFVTIRVNTIKSNKEEIRNILDKENISYLEDTLFKDAFILKGVTSKEIYDLDICKSGKIYLQNLSSQLPPILLKPLLNSDILDMCAAPGSKTTYLAALAGNNTRITACEVNKIRMERLKFNVLKQEASCVNFMLVDSKKLDDYFRFDQILLDAPCSGSGTLSVFNQSFKSFSKNLIYNSQALQISLLKKAFTILKPGCEMIYSTCSILDIENEIVVNNALKGKNYEIVSFSDDIKKHLPLLPCKIEGALNIMPNEFYEGFFVVKIKKIR